MPQLIDSRYNKAINAFTYGFNCLVLDPQHNQLHDCIISIHQVYINILHAIISKKVSFLLKLHEIYNISDNEFSTQTKLKQFGVHNYLILYTQSLQSFIFAFKTQYEKQIFKIGMVLFVRQAKLYYDRLNEYNPFKAESMMTFLDADQDGGNLLDIEEIQTILSKMKIFKTRQEILRDIEQIDRFLFQQEKLKRPKDMKNTQLNDLGFEYLLRYYTIKDDLLKYFSNFCNQYKPKVRSAKVSIVEIVRYNQLPIMSASQLCEFFERIMFQNMTQEQGLQLIRSFPIYDQEGRQKKQKLEMISFNNFCCIISSRKNSAYIENKKQLYQAMTNPITDYYISADFSHYSLRDDKSEVKINHFQLALKRGARCLHVHIQQTKQGQPYVKNSSSSSKSSLQEIFKIISIKGFQFNHFPILLMIQYGVMTKTGLDFVAKTLNEVFQDQLYKLKSKFQEDEVLPSPEQLKFKVIIMSNVNQKLFKAKEKEFPDESMAFFKSVSLFATKLDFQRKGQFAWNYCVLQNEKIQKLQEVEDQNLSNYSKKLIIKTGPTPQKGEEINRPTSVYLRLGIQLVGLNFKKPNEENYLLQSLFMENGGPKSGYLLKPVWMCLKNPKNLYSKNFQIPLFILTIKIISAQNCIINNFQGQKVYAEIYLVGNKKEESSNKKYTTSFQSPGYYIQFNLDSEFTIYCIELATIMFLVRCQQTKQILSGRAIPVRHLRQGLHPVYLMGQKFKQSVSSYLLTHIKKKQINKKAVNYLQSKN